MKSLTALATTAALGVALATPAGAVISDNGPELWWSFDSALTLQFGAGGILGDRSDDDALWALLAAATQAEVVAAPPPPLEVVREVVRESEELDVYDYEDEDYVELPGDDDVVTTVDTPGTLALALLGALALGFARSRRR